MAEKFGLLDDGSESNMLTSATEVALVADFWNTMEKTGSDFTNTFRDLAGITKSPDMTSTDEATLQKLLSHCAPKDELIAKVKSQYEDQPRLMQILEMQPQVLRLYGMDPDAILEEIRAAKAER